jgi:hypothetical protein
LSDFPERSLLEIGQHDNNTLGGCGLDASQHFHPAHARQLDVEHHGVGTKPLESQDGLDAVACLPDDSKFS